MAQRVVAASGIESAATEFLSSLTVEQRAHTTFDFDDVERETWHYTPVTRNGLARRDMDEAQAEASERLMATFLSKTGLHKARAIMGHEAILGRAEAGEGTLRFDRDTGLYFFSVFGAPDSHEPWGWQVDGHHLSLNFTLRDGLKSCTPSFFGANPAEVLSGPQRGLRILKDEEDLARELLLNLSPESRQLATIYPVAPADIITRASIRAEIGQPVGLRTGAMTGYQRDLLVRLIKLYIDKMSDDTARTAYRKIEDEGIDNILFGWAGSEHRGQGHYYRLHGPSFLVEYDNTQNGANHIHSVWRDIANDFGVDTLLSHYQEHHM